MDIISQESKLDKYAFRDEALIKRAEPLKSVAQPDGTWWLFCDDVMYRIMEFTNSTGVGEENMQAIAQGETFFITLGRVTEYVTDRLRCRVSSTNGTWWSVDDSDVSCLVEEIHHLTVPSDLIIETSI